jgi:hypothetical protein
VVGCDKRKPSHPVISQLVISQLVIGQPVISQLVIGQPMVSDLGYDHSAGY